jgi:hypothetical protein
MKMEKKSLQKSNQINVVAVVLLFLVVIFLSIMSYLVISGKWIFGISEFSEKSINQTVNRSETFGVSGDEAGNFSAITIDPFQLKEGERQNIILALKNSSEIKTVKAVLKDGSGAQEKDFALLRADKNNNTVFYQLTWQPKYLVLGASYPVEFKYRLKSGEEHKMTLFWDAISF